VLGIPLHQVAEKTTIALTDLPESERGSVREGVQSTTGLPGARGVIDTLERRLLPPCPTTPVAPTVTVPPVAATPTPDPLPGQLPQNGVDPAAPGAGVVVPTTPPVESTPIQTAQSEPGQTCRPVS
jgi:hypothetical protein